MDKAWLIANLEDARQELERAITEIQALEAGDEHVAQQLVGEAYLKLNYAWNSRAGAPESQSQSRYEELIRYPNLMDIYSGGDGEHRPNKQLNPTSDPS